MLLQIKVANDISQAKLIRFDKLTGYLIVILNKYSLGIGDRFGHQAKAQLSAIIKANKYIPKNSGSKQLSKIVPVWNKSFREHTIIGTKPSDTRRQVDEAVKSCLWEEPYFVDADHISLNNVDEFIAVCDFFTLDVADFISKPAAGSIVSLSSHTT